MRAGEGVAEAVTTASFMRCKCNGCTMVSKTIREGSTPSQRVKISIMEVCGMNVESRNSEKAWNRAIVKAEQEAAKKKMERLAKMRAKSKRK